MLLALQASRCSSATRLGALLLLLLLLLLLALHLLPCTVCSLAACNPSIIIVTVTQNGTPEGHAHWRWCSNSRCLPHLPPLHALTSPDVASPLAAGLPCSPPASCSAAWLMLCCSVISVCV
jgi:hypothetical protein